MTYAQQVVDVQYVTKACAGLSPVSGGTHQIVETGFDLFSILIAQM